MLAVDAVNRPVEFMVAKALIANRTVIAPERLADEQPEEHARGHGLRERRADLGLLLRQPHPGVAQREQRQHPERHRVVQSPQRAVAVRVRDAQDCDLVAVGHLNRLLRPGNPAAIP